MDCDGVHVGQGDAPYAQARKLMGEERIVGVTCHDSRDLAFAAASAGADYVAFGAFFPTTAKGPEGPKGKPEIDLLSWWHEGTNVPSVAIGGITPQNCAALVTAGADFIAAISAIWQHPQGPEKAVADFNQAVSSILK